MHFWRMNDPEQVRRLELGLYVEMVRFMKAASKPE